ALAGRIGVRVARIVVVGDHDDVSAGELRAMFGLPFRLLVLRRISRAVRVARRRNANRPTAVDVLLSLDHEDGLAGRDRLIDVVLTIQDASVSAASAPLPIAAAVAVTDAKARDVAFREADFLKSRIVIGRGEVAACAVAALPAFTFYRAE